MPSQSTRYFATLYSVSCVVGMNGTAASRIPSAHPHTVQTITLGRAIRSAARSAANITVEPNTATVACGNPPQTEIPSVAPSTASQSSRTFSPDF